MTTRAQTAQHKKAFLAHYREAGNISRACDAAAVERRTVYKWQEHDDGFALAFKQAQVEAVEALEAEAYRRAVEGVEEPLHSAGRMIGTVRRYSDTLLIFLLKGAAPAKYRERYDAGPGGGTDDVTVGYGDGVAGIAGDGLPA
jgi:hypothetical protein